MSIIAHWMLFLLAGFQVIQAPVGAREVFAGVTGSHQHTVSATSVHEKISELRGFANGDSSEVASLGRNDVDDGDLVTDLDSGDALLDQKKRQLLVRRMGRRNNNNNNGRGRNNNNNNGRGRNNNNNNGRGRNNNNNNGRGRNNNNNNGRGRNNNNNNGRGRNNNNNNGRGRNNNNNGRGRNNNNNNGRGRNSGGGGSSGGGSSGGLNRRGDLTFYGGAGRGGACTQTWVPPGFRTVAINSPEFNGGAACGQCVEGCYTARGRRICFKAIVDNLCPECKRGDLDLGTSGDGRWPLQWKPINCPQRSGILMTQQGSNGFYAKLKAEGGATPVLGMSCNGRSGSRSADNYFIFNDGGGGFCGTINCSVRYQSGSRNTNIRYC